MKKLFLICLSIVTICVLQGCSGVGLNDGSTTENYNNESQTQDITNAVSSSNTLTPHTSPDNKNTPSTATEQTTAPNVSTPIPSSSFVPIDSSDVDEYMVFPTKGGIYRQKYDLSDLFLILSDDQYSEFLGIYEEWIYYLDENFSLCKIDLNAQNKKEIYEDIYYACMAEGKIYFNSDDVIYEVYHDDSVAALLKIPNDLNEIEELIIDNTNLYICTESDEAGCCSLYKCDFNKDTMDLVFKKVVNGMNFAIKNDYVYEENMDNEDGETRKIIVRRNVNTKKEQELISFKGLFIDIVVTNEVIVFTNRTEDGKYYLNIYNLETADTYSIESKGNYLYESTNVFVIETNTRTIYRLEITTGKANQIKVG